MIGQRAQPQAPSLEVRFHRLEINYRWALGIAVIAIVALGALVLWNAYSAASQAKGEQVVTQLVTAWGSHDGALLEATYAEDAVLISAGAVKHEGIQAIKGFHQLMASHGFKPEVIGPVVQSGTTVVAPIKLTWSDGTAWYVTSIFELNPAGKVVHHQDYGQTE
jgi:SnoaL-like domain